MPKGGHAQAEESEDDIGDDELRWVVQSVGYLIHCEEHIEEQCANEETHHGQPRRHTGPWPHDEGAQGELEYSDQKEEPRAEARISELVDLAHVASCRAAEYFSESARDEHECGRQRDSSCKTIHGDTLARTTVSFEIDIDPKPENTYRIVVWTIGPSFERKYPRLVALDADLAVAARSANEVRLLKHRRDSHSSMAWVGRHVQRGLGILGFAPTYVRLDGARWDQRLEWIAPVLVNGPVGHHLLAVWAMNEKAQVTFKSKPPASQLHQMVRLHRTTLKKPTVVAGDFNNNPIFHRNDPNHDMLELVALLDAHDLVSAYHAFTGLEHGDPREAPTRFQVDPIGQEVGHHVDYCFVPSAWIPALRSVQIGQRDTWIKSLRFEEHVPVVVDFDLAEVREITLGMKRARR